MADTNNTERKSLESVFRSLSDRAYCNYIEQMRRPECLGWEHKVKHGKFGQTELEGHAKAAQQLGRHRAFAEAANALRGSDAPLNDQPQPNAALADGWMPIDTAPRDGSKVMLFWSGEVTQGFWMVCDGVGDGKRKNWIRDQFGLGLPRQETAPSHWRPLPAPPTLNASKGE